MNTRGVILSLLYGLLKMLTPEIFYAAVRSFLEWLQDKIELSDNKVDDLALTIIQMILDLLPEDDEDDA